MNDTKIRTALTSKLRSLHGATAEVLIINELGLRHGLGRVDIAVIGGSLHGYEIKGVNDTLRRLPSQIDTYDAVLDRSTLVVSRNHLDKAIGLVPPWWGVELAEPSAGGGVALYELRPPRDNPSPDPVCIAKLLWRAEALAILETVGAASGLSVMPRRAVHARLAEVLELDQLRGLVRRQLRSRQLWRAGGLRTSGGG